MPGFTQCHLPMSCSQAPILPLAPELHPSSLCALIPAVARLRREESNLGGFHSCAVPSCTEGYTWHRSQYAPGWTEESNLLGALVAVCPPFVPKYVWKQEEITFNITEAFFLLLIRIVSCVLPGAGRSGKDERGKSGV